ncbi:unnamed protein product [Trichogramma brassicae]|uniref:Uncharacterized protein n=1 Tax=Trichogramma brassicae TaxID=86971 RepID=A0A6H5I0Y3_9HYME|nr:unnamed protein product [Trichogramma brassicae]
MTELRKTDDCYEQLPVTFQNQSMFLAPRTRILVANGKEVQCDGRLPPMFNLGDQWYRSIPHIVPAATPEILAPKMTPAWKYISPESLAIGGIYSEKDTKKLRDLIVFPLKRGAIMNTILRGATGHHVNTDGISISPFLTEKILNDIAANSWSKIWGGFISFGTYSAGLIGIFMFFRAVKLIVDTTIHSYALYTIYGWSIHLLGALWDSVTYLLLHIGQRRQHEGHVVNIERLDREREIQREGDRHIYAENIPMIQQEPTTLARDTPTAPARDTLTALAANTDSSTAPPLPSEYTHASTTKVRRNAWKSFSKAWVRSS